MSLLFTIAADSFLTVFCGSSALIELSKMGGILAEIAEICEAQGHVMRIANR